MTTTLTTENTIEDSDKILKFANVVLAIGIILILIAPFVVTRQAIFSEFDFHETGQIGDTIGGITAPILSLVGSILVFLALKAQINANAIVINQFNLLQKQALNDKRKEGLYLRIGIIRDDLKSFTHLKVVTKGNNSVRNDYIGIDAINTFFNFIYNEEDCNGVYEDIFMQSKHQQLESILSLIESLLHQIEINNFEKEDRGNLKYFLLYQYNSLIRPAFIAHLDGRSSKTKACPECKKFHKGVSEKLFYYFDRIEALSSST